MNALPTDRPTNGPTHSGVGQRESDTSASERMSEQVVQANGRMSEQVVGANKHLSMSGASHRSITDILFVAMFLIHTLVYLKF